MEIVEEQDMLELWQLSLKLISMYMWDYHIWYAILKYTNKDSWELHYGTYSTLSHAK